VNYPVPQDEIERLNTLRGYGILDTHPEERFDDLTRLAAYICDAPISLISLVDEDRQWFKSRKGVELCQTERKDAICAHAIMSPDLFIVPDASQDPRFATNPLVVGAMHVRFYAGAPLTAPNGHHLGALCVMDRVSRHLSHEQLDALCILSRQVMAQVVFGKNLSDLRTALDARDYLEDDMQELIQELTKAGATIHTLKGLVPICSWCKKVRNDQGYWEKVEAYIAQTVGIDITSSICPECLQKNFGEVVPPPDGSPGTNIPVTNIPVTNIPVTLRQDARP